MKLIVKNLKGTQFEIQVEGADTVEQVKKRIETEQGIETSTQKLVAVGKVMADDKTIEEYKLKDGDFIVVMIAKPKVKKEKKPEVASTPASGQPSAPTGMAGVGQSQPAQQPNASAVNAPPPVPNQQPGQDVNTGGEDNGILKGEALENTLKEMQEMGFPRDECMRALRAAYYVPDRAVEYLLSGIPEDAEDHHHSQPGAANPGASSSAGAGLAGLAGAGAGGAGGDNPLSFLQDNPMFNQLRQRLVSDPSFFQTFMTQLAQTQPQLHQAISANPQAFLGLLLGSGGGEGGMGAPESDPPGTIRVTQEEKDAIERLTGLGFPKHRAIEAFFACDKNEEWAANYLFENCNIDDNYDQEVVQEESAAEAGVQPLGDAQMQPEQQEQPSNPPASNEEMQVDNPAAENPPADNQPAQNPPAEGGQNPPAEEGQNQPDNQNNNGGANENNDEDESAF